MATKAASAASLFRLQPEELDGRGCSRQLAQGCNRLRPVIGCSAIHFTRPPLPHLAKGGSGHWGLTKRPRKWTRRVARSRIRKRKG
jgi:hypothetical protein